MIRWAWSLQEQAWWPLTFLYTLAHFQIQQIRISTLPRHVLTGSWLFGHPDVTPLFIKCQISSLPKIPSNLQHLPVGKNNTSPPRYRWWNFDYQPMSIHVQCVFSPEGFFFFSPLNYKNTAKKYLEHKTFSKHGFNHLFGLVWNSCFSPVDIWSRVSDWCHLYLQGFILFQVYLTSQPPRDDSVWETDKHNDVLLYIMAISKHAAVVLSGRWRMWQEH